MKKKGHVVTRIVSSLRDISDGYDAVFCDLWGCLHNGHAPYPAAVQALQAYRAKGGRVCLMTNAPRPSDRVIAQLDRMGVPRDAWDIVASSGDATLDAMRAGDAGMRVWHIGTAKDDPLFAQAPAITRVPLDEAEGIVATGPFDEWSEIPEDYRRRFEIALHRGLPMLSANPDLIVDMGHRRIYCAGALALLYAQMGGQVASFGKPHAPIYDLARRRLDLPADARCLAIGDGILTDVAGAAAQGIDALFVPGGLAFDQFGDDIENPALDLLLPWLTPHALSPTYAIGRLR